MIAVLGAGVMGTAIATLAIGHGVPVTLVDTDADKLAAAEQSVRRQLRGARLVGAMPRSGPVGELTRTGDLDDVAGASAVIEAVTELPDLKAKVLAAVSSIVAPGTLLLTNTSAIPVDELASAVDRPEDVAGAHFMNPPYLIRMVEVIRGPRTSEAAMAAVRDLLGALDRDHVTVGDGPGFVINRVLQRTINEAARIVGEGIATPEDVDALFQGCLGHRTGPLATADLIGLDNVVDSLRVLHERTGDAGYAPCDLLLAKVHEGRFGRKTGQGFYDHGGAQS
ncbi:3-hydroxyacyl-CoA dehydrogenase family protein [Umezawaea endophytica]|uniref:3-hydroxyacyl-CoA dehydrogenase family protein n=1 Tax=Umezawaea endophytica TaxID=1654476 RepID=A0A9X2VI18_9PSEU|nr:3-hydroxyacyl-CoA dehydrogenase family protein [Umezawaea endophytica]MCS7476764.1 3-hydroxyacyl-CoA dehydrogenase family protein [Umezawaea endophytica]